MKSDAVFVPSGALEQSLYAGDVDGVIAVLQSMTLQERKACAASLRPVVKRLAEARWNVAGHLDRWWGKKLAQDEIAATGVALFFCGNREDRAFTWGGDLRLYPFLDMLEPGALDGLAADLVREHPSNIFLAQQLVRDGLSQRPDSDDYILAIMAVPHLTRGHAAGVLDLIEKDPGLLDGTLYRLFDVEGGGETSMANVEKFSRGDNNWTFALLEMIRTGRLSRATLLDKALSALEQDWSQYRAGWFSRFHDVLAPTLDEMTSLRERYVKLCHSRIAPTVTFALNALAVLQKCTRLESRALLEALVPVMSSAVKGQVDAALKLLDQVVANEPGRAHAGAAVAWRGLAHASADIHKKIIVRLSAWGFDADTSAELAAMLPHVSALHRDSLAALIGQVSKLTDSGAPCATHEVAGLMPPLDPARRLVLVDTVAELVQVIAHVFENDSATDEFERAMAALGRLAPLVAGQADCFSPVRKRALAVVAANARHAMNDSWDIGGRGGAIGEALAHVLAFVFERSPFVADPVAFTVRNELFRRVEDLITFMAQDLGVSSLSCATHKRGFIDPLVLVERIDAHARAGALSSLAEQVRALLRLAPGPAPEALRRARELDQTPLVQALRHALGDDVEIGTERALFIAAARIRHPDADDARVLAAYGDMGPDAALAARYSWLVVDHVFDTAPTIHALCLVDVFPSTEGLDPRFIAMRRYLRFAPGGFGVDGYGGESMLRYGATILPSSLSWFFACGALQIGNNLDWGVRRWHDKAYLSVALDRTVPATPCMIALLAVAMGGKEPGQTAMAVDAFVAVLVEGRADVASLAEPIRWMILASLGTCARYARTLAHAARAHPCMPGAVFTVLCTIVDIGHAAPPKNVGALLELLIELSVEHGLAVPNALRDRIALLTLTGKSKAAQKELLAKTESPA